MELEKLKVEVLKIEIAVKGYKGVEGTPKVWIRLLIALAGIIQKLEVLERSLTPVEVERVVEETTEGLGVASGGDVLVGASILSGIYSALCAMHAQSIPILGSTFVAVGNVGKPNAFTVYVGQDMSGKVITIEATLPRDAQVDVR